jgi:hypothetical protein
MRKAAVFAVAALAWACPGSDRAPPRAPGVREPEMMLALRDHGGAAIAADARWIFVTSWHAVGRVEKTTGEVTDLHVEPTGGIVPSAVAADVESVYFVVRGACRDDLARAAECASIRAVPKLGGASRAVCELARGEEAPVTLAVGSRHVWFATKNRVMRAPEAGGGAEIFAEAEERVRGLAVDGDRVYYNDGAKLVGRAPDEPERTIGRVDLEGYVAIAFDAAAVYWIFDGKVWRVEKTGGVPEVMGEARSEQAHLAADDVGLAWTEPHDLAVAVKRRGAQVARARLREERPEDVALDPRFAFATAIDPKDGSTRIVRVER